MNSSDWPILSRGLLFGFGLIIAIGAQNAFVLRQGLNKSHVFIAAFISSLGDTLLMVLGIGGLGAFIANNETLSNVSIWGGGIFLFYFGARSFMAALKKEGFEDLDDLNTLNTRKKTILSALAFSFLNPHVYLDTVVLVGSLGAQYPPDQRWIFGAGAIASSWIWFFALAYGAVLLSPIFNKATFRRVVDLIIALIMWSISWTLIGQPLIDFFRNI